jgi:hypothetical protein
MSVAVAALFATGCAEYNLPEAREKRSVALGGASSAQVRVEMGAGELRIEGGAEGLLDGEFVYNSRERPEVRYDVSGGRGYLSVRQPPAHGLGKQVHRWELRLNDRSATDLRIHMGAGQAVLKLSGMALTRLEVDLGAGEINLDLTGPWDRDLEATVRGGVGEATVRLPRQVGVRVHASGGIGGVNASGLTRSGHEYVNEIYGKSPVTVRVHVTGGIGEINLIG